MTSHEIQAINQDSQQTCVQVAKITTPEHSQDVNIIDTIMFSNVINVIIVIALIIWLMRKFNLLAILAKRRDEVLEIIKNFNQDRMVKQHQLEQTKNKVKNINQEVLKIMDEGEHVAESLSERIIMDAEEEASYMHKKAHSMIETERKMASNLVMQDVTNAAFKIAEIHIKEAIDERLQQKYINEFIDNLDRLKV
ncbi:MAG TPA: hypothetical protein P5556_09465 [Candidatus Gastranaerophilales bacterium]|nr:hypothetical protein [Candidatus Gastranaerophilales bacterium]